MTGEGSLTIGLGGLRSEPGPIKVVITLASREGDDSKSFLTDAEGARRIARDLLEHADSCDAANAEAAS